MPVTAERIFANYRVKSTAAPEGARFTALLAVTPSAANGFPTYYAVCENRSFRTLAAAEEAAAGALDAVEALEADGTPIFPAGYTGFDDPAP